MSEPVAHPGLLKDNLSQMKQVLSTILYALAMPGLIILYFLALFVAGIVFYCVTRFSSSKWSVEDVIFRTQLHAISFGMSILSAAYTGEEVGLVPALWYGLGVGCIVFGGLLVVEVAIMALYFCCARIRGMDHQKQDFIEIGGVAQDEETSSETKV